MKPILFCIAALILLGSATPPPRPGPALPPLPKPGLAALDPAALGDAPADCGAAAAGGCTLLANGAGEIVAVLTPDTAPDPAREEERAPSGVGVRVVVSIPQQKAYVFRGGALFATTRVSTGKRGHETPVGIFHVMEKEVHHRSNRYSNAPMPFMERLTNSGIALHAGHVPGYPASHGCIRLPWGFARKLYSITDPGTRVTITRRRPRSASEALGLA